MANQRASAWQRFRAHRPASFSATVLALGIALLLIWPGFAHPAIARFLPVALAWSPDTASGDPHQPPGWQHWFGTDAQGRDLLSRLIHGTRVSLLVGVVAAGLSLLIGVGCGAVAGFLGGRWDGVLMRVVDGLRSVPVIVLVLLLIAWLESPVDRWLQPTFDTWPGLNARLVLLCVGLGSVSWATLARLVRDQLLALRQSGPVEAARVLGAGPLWLWTRHMQHNLWRLVLVALLPMVPAVMLYETFLSYLGLGIQPPQASLGSILADGVAGSTENGVCWRLFGFPAAMVVLFLLTFHRLGTGLRAAWGLTSGSGRSARG